MDDVVKRIDAIELGEDETFGYQTVFTIDWEGEESIHDLYYRVEQIFETLSAALDEAMGEHDPDLEGSIPDEVREGLHEVRYWGDTFNPEPVLVVGWLHEDEAEGPVEILAALVDLSKVHDGHFIEETRY